ncbi:diacylglycerol lipase-beta [Caerostris darwini]|uniref:sn-1-specific diacylglycerol lipase n=1 Tax=Caerostris darwini TaxID=1538125 RepID=A0AAV4MNC7_9ARAC|nr:diacylglycerol lipase-beta [Caerostris darwini]
MGGMRLFGRRCALASDDFFFIGVIDLIFFLPWLSWIVVIYVSFLENRSSCSSVENFMFVNISLFGLIILIFVNLILGALYVCFSTRGTISNPEPRYHVATVTYVKLFVCILDLMLAIYGTIVLYRGDFCDIIGVSSAIKVSTIFQWVGTCLRIFSILSLYDWNFTKHSKEGFEKEYFNGSVRKGTLKRWNLRLQTIFLWCTSSTEARKQAMQTASELLALLSCDLDLVVSDVVAGLLLYRQKCFELYQTEKHALAKAPAITTEDGELVEQFPPPSFPPWMNLQLASKYFDLGLGVFGWPWVMYRNFTCGCCHLSKKIMCCFTCRKQSQIVVGDNCCGCNVAGLQVTSGIKYEDLVHVSFVDKVFDVPFFVTYDHETKVILVVARGTMSMDDVLTDVAATFSAMDDPGCPPGILCHGGMLNAAREVKSKMESKQILDNAFLEHPDYELVITGHSLGGSVAAIITMLYKQKYPNVRCFSFAPSPIFNASALKYTYENIFTVIYGNDAVCYLNYENIKQLVVEMVQGLKECNLPKYKILMRPDRPLPNNTENNCQASETPQRNYGTSMLNEGANGTVSVNMNEAEPDVTNFSTENFYVAGRILHIRRTKQGYRLKLSSAFNYKPLFLRPKYIKDHFPQFTQKALWHLGTSPVITESAVMSIPVKKERKRRNMGK